jgi:DUF2889 family protein
MLMTWPDGIGTQLHLVGRCRDFLTPVAGEPSVLTDACLQVGIGPDRVIERVESEPSLTALEGIVGARGGGNLRSVINDVVPEVQHDYSPLYLLLDDVAGASLIAGFAWTRWSRVMPDLAERFRNHPPRYMEGICSGFRPGASSLSRDGTTSGIPHNVAAVPPLVDPDDAVGWHELDPEPCVGMRRSRRIDVYLEGDRIVIDAMFRDSSWEPDGTEIAVHEYQVDATVDRATGAVRSVTADPRVLPYRECPGAAPNAAWLAGAPVGELRTEVLERLRLTDCCTHLNDALRALAEVPILASALTQGPSAHRPKGAEAES